MSTKAPPTGVSAHDALSIRTHFIPCREKPFGALQADSSSRQALCPCSSAPNQASTAADSTPVLEFSAVTFAYPQSEQLVLSKCSLEVTGREIRALVASVHMKRSATGARDLIVPFSRMVYQLLWTGHNEVLIPNGLITKAITGPLTSILNN